MPPIVPISDFKDGQFDGVIVVSDSMEHLPTSVQSAQSTFMKYLEVSAFCWLYFVFYLFVQVKVALSKMDGELVSKLLGEWEGLKSQLCPRPNTVQGAAMKKTPLQKLQYL